jgi:hypothetical protein
MLFIAYFTRDTCPAKFYFYLNIHIILCAEYTANDCFQVPWNDAGNMAVSDWLASWELYDR